MIVSAMLSPTSVQSIAQSDALGVNSTGAGSSFAASLVSASAAQPASGPDATSNANRSFRHGRLSIDMHADGQRINGMSYFDEAGQKLTTSGFWPQDILRQCERFNIPLSDLHGLGPQLDAAGVRYKPYEQYAGTGSNHGIDLDDLATGGMGTAYDWTQDALVHLKGPSARSQLQADQALAQRLGLRPVVVGINPSGNAGASIEVVSPSETSASPKSSVGDTVTMTAASAGSPAIQSKPELDNLQQLISQVMTNLQQSVRLPSATLTSTVQGPIVRTAPHPSVPGITNEQVSSASGTNTINALPSQRISQLNTLLEQLLSRN